VRSTPAVITARIVILAVLSFSAGLQCVVATAAPGNAAIEAKRKQADAASAKVDKLATDLELKGEELAEVEDAVTKTRQQIAVTEEELLKANADLAATQGILNRRVSSIYRKGKVDMVSVFVGATDFSDFITRVDLLRRIGRSDASVVASVKQAKSRVETAQQSLETRQAEQLALRSRARAKQDEVKTAYEEQRKYLSGLTSELKKLVAEERARQERLAAQRAAEAAARAAALGRNNIHGPGVRTFDPDALGASHPGAVSIARKYLGVRYVWGGTTPSGFDCSGLTRFAYAALGISIPRTSRQQYRIGAYIPPNRLDLLQPGDLVFFGYDGAPSRIHHVGMYVGGGQFIHAPQTGDVVRISSLNGRIATRGDYVGATRP
jgi:peptidoglycan DL-endopeptidase CwlO